MTSLPDDFDATGLFSPPVEPETAAQKQAKKQSKEKEQAAAKQSKEFAKAAKDAEKQQAAQKKKEMKEAKEKDESITPTEHQRLKQMVLRYRNSDRFGPYLEANGFKSLTPARIEKMKPKDLRSTYEQIQASLGARGTETFVQNLAMRGIALGELALSWSRFKVPGLARKLENDEHFMGLLEEAQIQYLSLGVVDLRIRIAVYVAMKGLECNRAAAGRAVEKAVKAKKNKEGGFSEDVQPDVKTEKKSTDDPSTFL